MTASRAGLVELLLADLAAESGDLDVRVADLDAGDWLRPTPAQGWDIRDTVTHLHQTDLDALLAVTDPPAFAAFSERLVADPPPGHVERTVAAGRTVAPAALLAAWREDRGRLAAAIGAVPDGNRVPWFGPRMSVPSFVSARLMETWAHGQDVADALSQVRVAGARLRHVAEICVRARPFSYLVNGRQPPATPVRVELAAPDGSEWAWGPAGATNLVRGAALDFCLLVTQRRHIRDLALDVAGADAHQWLSIAQAFAGSPGAGREPL